jgi:hypothetical protein
VQAWKRCSSVQVLRATTGASPENKTSNPSFKI